MRLLTAISLSLTALSVPVIAPAQERVLTVFGNDKCPENTICVRAPEADRFRIPKELREPSTRPANQSWATRARATVDTGSTSPSACVSASANGGPGCLAEAMRKAREEARTRRNADGTVGAPNVYKKNGE